MEEHITPQTSSHQPQRHVSDSKPELERRFTTFALLWALGSILVAWDRIEFALSNPVSMAIHVGIGFTAFVVLFRPKRSLPFTVLAFLHVVYGLVQMPILTSTDLMWMLFGATVCASFLSGWIRSRSLNISAVELYRSIAPCLRIMLVLAILAIGIARFNFCFINLESSPVVYVLTQIRHGEPPQWVSCLAISTLLVVDLFVASALLIPSLRRFAVGFGTCYFGSQAIIGFAETRTMLPLLMVGLVLFMSSELIGRIYNNIERWIPFPALRSAGINVAIVMVAIAAMALWFQDQDAKPTMSLTSHQVVGAFYAGLVSLWTVTLLASLLDQRPKLTWVSLMIRNPIHYLLLSVMVIFAVSPYVGLGPRFAELSGLSTAGGANNHLLVPQTYLVEHETDLVEIIESNDPYLDSLADKGLLITWFDLVNYVLPRPKTSLLFVRGDNQFRVDEAGDIGELSIENSWFARKMFAYGPVDRNTIETGRLVGVNR